MLGGGRGTSMKFVRRLALQVKWRTEQLGWFLSSLFWAWGPVFSVWLTWVLLSLIPWGESEADRIRLLGMVLQLLGFCLTAWGLLGATRAFVLPGSRAWLQDWWNSRPYAHRTISVGAS